MPATTLAAPTATLGDVVDPDALAAARADGLVRAQRHPDGGRVVLNYTNQAQHRGVWTPTTRACRGLIVAADDPRALTGAEEVVARPMAKFFNIAEHAAPGLADLDLDQPFEAADKLDGCLAIAYPGPDGATALATRGSFTSDQAIAATALWRQRYADVVVPPGQTWLFEYVGPDNRIVVAYDHPDLCLLAVVDTASGAELWRPGGDAAAVGWPGPTAALAATGDGRADLEALLATTAGGDGTAEGFVVRFADGTRAKAKYAEYVRLHRLLTGTTARRVWELLADGRRVDELLAAVPEEFADWVRATAEELTAAHDAILDGARAELAHPLVADAMAHPGDAERRKRAAAHLRAHAAHAHFAFALMDGKHPDDLATNPVWRLVRPAHETPFAVDE